MLRKLKELVYMNRYPQLSASELEALREDTNEVMLLPSSNDYGWFTSFNSGESYIINAEVITLGRARYANIKYCNGPFISSNNHIIETKDKNQLRTRYLYNFLSYTSKTYYVESTSYPKFEKDIFENTTLDVPEVSVQDARIKELDFFNNAIFDEKRRLSEFDSLIKSRFNEMFSNCGLTYLGEYIEELRGGKSLAGVNPCKNKVLKTGAATFGFFDSKQYKYLPIDYIPDPRHKVEKGDVIISRMNTPELVGTCSYVWDVPDNYYYPDRLWKTIVKPHVEPIFIWQTLQQKEARVQIQSLASGTSGTMFNISKPKMLSIKIPKADFSKQSEFASFVEKVDKLKFNCQQRIKLYQELLNKKMDEYFG